MARRNYRVSSRFCTSDETLFARNNSSILLWQTHWSVLSSLYRVETLLSKELWKFVPSESCEVEACEVDKNNIFERTPTTWNSWDLLATVSLQRKNCSRFQWTFPCWEWEWVRMHQPHQLCESRTPRSTEFWNNSKLANETLWTGCSTTRLKKRSDSCCRRGCFLPSWYKKH